MNRIAYNIKQALKQINRNKGMSFASVFAITAMMLILGLFFVVTVNINLFTETIKEDYDQVEIFLKDEVTIEEASTLKEKLDNSGHVTNSFYRSKEDALNIMKKRWGESGYLLDSLGENPLPNSILVTVDSIDSANKVIDICKTENGIEDTKYYKETVEKLTKITDNLQLAAIVIMIFLVVVSVVVVSNTIKLTVFAREREISIMKYIGATNWFIRGPFLVEGILIGVFSSLVSAGITYLVYNQVEEHIGIQLMTMLSTPLVPAGYLAWNLVCIFLAIGISVGAGGSIISMRRFLDTGGARNRRKAIKREQKQTSSRDRRKIEQIEEYPSTPKKAEPTAPIRQEPQKIKARAYTLSIDLDDINEEPLQEEIEWSDDEFDQ